MLTTCLWGGHVHKITYVVDLTEENILLTRISYLLITRHISIDIQNVTGVYFLRHYHRILFYAIRQFI